MRNLSTPDPINELLVFTRQELLAVFKDWYASFDDEDALNKAIDGVDYVIHHLNENKQK